MTNLDLAKEFKLLAEDRYWPCNCRMESCATMRQFKIAQLALMVVELVAFKEECSCVIEAAGELGINPDHYYNVKERVEEANGN